MFKRKIKLRATIAVGVLLITVTLATVLLLLNWLSSARTVRAFTRELLNPVALQVTEQIRDILDDAVDATELTASLIGEVPAGLRPDTLDAVGFAMLGSAPDLAYVQLGLPDGGWARVNRLPDGSLESQRRTATGVEASTMPAGVTVSRRAPGAARHEILDRSEVVDDDYDPRTRPWYVGAREKSGVFISDAYSHGPDEKIVVTAAIALPSAEGADAGVVSVAITLDDLALMLARLRVAGRPIRAFVLDPRQGTLAAAGAAPVRGSGGIVTLPRLDQTEPPVLRALARNHAFQSAIGSGEDTSLAYDVDGERQLAFVKPLTIQGREWIAGAVVAEDDFLGGIRQDIFRTILVSLGVIGLFIAISSLLAKSIADPLQAIAVETEHLRRLDFSQRPLPGTMFEEIADINSIFGSLKSGLRGFGKYVPLKLVQGMLAEGIEPGLGGRSEELSILFSDIQGFTEFAEQLDADDMARILGDYLASLAGIVADESGTVDKYIGDGMMAFWNAPHPVADHAERAVMAAIRCRDAIAAMPEANRLRTRFGIHSDRVIVGNFGAPDRFGYTAIGDGVNLAARLERVNNEYGTLIIASDATRRLAGHSVAWRRLDRIAVKGKQLPTEIHEALGVVGTIPAATLAAAARYEAGLEAYFDQDFPRAADLFAEALRLRPDDIAAEILRTRSLAYAAAPPAAGWNGVQVMLVK